MRSGMRTPLSKGFSLVLSSNSAFFGSCDQSATVCPLSDNSIAAAVPQPPGAKHYNVHSSSPGLGAFTWKWNLLSVPLKSLLMLLRCAHSTRSEMHVPSTVQAVLWNTKYVVNGRLTAAATEPSDT